MTPVREQLCPLSPVPCPVSCAVCVVCRAEGSASPISASLASARRFSCCLLYTPDAIALQLHESVKWKSPHSLSPPVSSEQCADCTLPCERHAVADSDICHEVLSEVNWKMPPSPATLRPQTSLLCHDASAVTPYHVRTPSRPALIRRSIRTHEHDSRQNRPLLPPCTTRQADVQPSTRRMLPSALADPEGRSHAFRSSPCSDAALLMIT